MLVVVVLSACGGADQDAAIPLSEDLSGESVYVGAKTCAGCHAEQAQLWAGSHHDLAMQVAKDVSVLGDFADAEFVHHDSRTVFSRRGDEYVVNTAGADGRPAEFTVRYTFGVYPLQQYLVELPDGKLQALSVAWDSRAAQAGGQRWFHVYGDERIDHNDVLHWTRPSQNWDTMCADCHSTGLIKRYDLETGSFDTSWAEINVACEACHGPGSRHVAWAGAPSASVNKGLTVALDERHDITWLLDDATGNSRRSAPRQSDTEINTCAPCHSRRSRIADAPMPGDEFLDGYLPALLREPLYHADGQIQDEVYVYGSFLQSRMYQQGVTCSDCHEPHSLALRAPGAEVCLQCHAAEKFATADHQLHPRGSVGANCIECHMPPTTYMQIDPRHDHSFRIPRPDLSVVFGTPLACDHCHTDADAGWALEVLRERNRLPANAATHWSTRLAESARSPLQSRDLLLGLAADFSVPDIVRVSAIDRLQLGGDAAASIVVGERALSSSPLIRWAVARVLQTGDVATRVRYGPALLDDPVRAVRLTTASALASLSLETLPAAVYPKLERGLSEYIDAQLVSAERAESHVNIGNLQRKRRRPEKSEQAYLTAIDLNPFFVPAYVNLADLYREQARESEADILLREALDRLPGQAALNHSLGLSLIRQGRMVEALEELALAAGSDDAIARFALVYALAVDAQGRSGEAIAYLETAIKRFGDDPSLLASLANIYQRMGNEQAARAIAERARAALP